MAERPASFGGGRWDHRRLQHASLPATGHDGGRNARRPRRARDRRRPRHRGGDGPTPRHRRRRRGPRRPHGEEIISVAEEITSRGGTAIPVRVDVTDEVSVSSCFETVRAELGNVTILVNNAGTPGVPLPVAATKPESWRRAFDVNVTGTFLCAREALPGMASANWGRIINVSSAAARHPVAGMAAYASSKAALDQLTRVLALEGEPYGISVMGVYPGVIDTRMQEESRSFGQNLIGKQLHRMFQGYKDYNMLRPPEEPADLINYLCTSPAKRLNGHIIRLEQLDAIKTES